MKQQVIKRRSGQKHFAEDFNFYQLFWVFFIGCFLGVVVETIWCVATRGHFESRKGLIYGPFNLVYGFGALLMTVGLRPLSGKNDAWTFGGGVAIGSVFEYLCSWFQEIVLGTVSWQYDSMPFNLHGRINLLYSMFWGILAVLWMRLLYPLMRRVIARIPNQWGKSATWILLVFMVFNSLVSGAAVWRMTQRREGIPPSNAVLEFLDSHFDDKRLMKIYPNMVWPS